MTLNETQLNELRGALPALPFDHDGPVFRAPWEAQAFAMTLALYERGVFTWNEWAHALSEAIEEARAAGDPDRGDTYYAHWLSALERLTAAKGCVSPGMLTHRRFQWDLAARGTPHGQPIQLRHALSAATLHQYEVAIYRIAGQPDIEMRIGVANHAVAALLARHGVASAVFVTAFNPFSHELAPEENAARHRALMQCIEASALRSLPGEGMDAAGIWVEASCLVLGATPETADALMIEFGQNAVVHVDREAVPRLLLHPDYR